MRLTTVILLASLLQVSAATFGQRITLNQKNIPLESVLKEFRKQSGYDIYYDSKVIPKDQQVNVALSNATLEEALNTIFKGLKLGFSIEGNIVSIKKAEQLYPDHPVRALDLISVEGRVIGENGQGLAGATIKVKGTDRGTSTNERGVFSFQKIDEDAIIQINYIGYKPKELKVTPNLGDIKMELATADLSEVSISTGYQLIKPEQSTGAISTIRAREYNNRINTTDILTGLQNKIPGLLINNDIQFEGNSLFQIRGMSTITASKTPLIILDGYPTELTLNLIDPNEIETITVLKDAAAATVYGARSSNGVIIIDRKKGKAGDVKVNVRTTTSLRPKEDYTRYRWDENASNIVVDYEKLRYATILATDWTNATGPNGKGFNYTAPMLVMANWRSNNASQQITLAERDRQLAEIASYNNSSDYSKLFLRTASTQTYNIDISGGSDKLVYYLTTNYNRSASNLINNGDDILRVSGRANMKLSKRLSLEFIADFSESTSKTAPVPSISTIYPYERFQDANGNPASLFGGSLINPYYNKYIQSMGLLDNRYYPLVDVNEVSDRVRTVSNRVTANFRYNTNKGFNFVLGAVRETSTGKNSHVANETSSEARQYINTYTSGSAATKLNYGVAKGAFIRNQLSNVQSVTVRGQANYDKVIYKDHSINMILGAEVRKTLTNSNSSALFGYNDQTLFSQAVDFRTLPASGSPYFNSNRSINYLDLFRVGYGDDRYISGYSNAVYSYKNKYSLTGSIRIDQSNLFGNDPKYRYKPLWSVGAGWNVDKEGFMEKIKWVNSLRLRTAYGFNGLVAKDALPQAIVADDQNNINSGAAALPSLTISSLANSGIRWEQTQNINFGLDFQIFNRVSGNIDYYLKNTEDILGQNQIDASKGRPATLVNLASIRNRGFELNILADWIKTRKLNWNTGFVLARNNNKVTRVYNAALLANSSVAYVQTGGNYLPGYSVGTQFTYRYAGLSNTGIPLMYGTDGNANLVTNGTAMRNAAYDDAGSTIPVYNFGLSNRVDIGDFYAYAMINYFGRFAQRVPVPNASALRPLEGAGNYWKQAGDENKPGILPLLSTATALAYYSNYMQLSDEYMVNGSYITIGDVTLAYSFKNSAITKKLGIRDFEVKAQASNIYTKAFNRFNYSAATGSYAKSYLTPTYSAAVSFNF